MAMGKGKKIAIGVGIAVAMFFAFVIVVATFAPTLQSDSVPSPATNQESSSPNSIVQTSKETTPDTPVQPTAPQMVSINDLTFKIVNATQHAQAITVIVNVENHGKLIETVSWLDFRLIDKNKMLYEDGRRFPPDKGQLAAMGEIAPSGNRDFKYVFFVPEGTQLAECRFVVLEDSNNPRYLELV